eukprot:SAG31_NODE_17583_length_665_cov_1.356890_1_plen_66_part_00
MIHVLKLRVKELEAMLLEKEAALQQLANHPDAHRVDELEAERRAYCDEVRTRTSCTRHACDDRIC